MIMIIFGVGRISHEKICLRAHPNGTGIGDRAAVGNRHSTVDDHVQGPHRDFFQRPIAAFFMGAALLMLLSPLLTRGDWVMTSLKNWKNSDRG